MVPRSRKYYEGATTSHWRIDDRLFFRFRRPRDPPVFCVRHGAPGGVGGPSPGPGIWLSVDRSADDFTWTPLGSLKYPGDPSCAFAPLLDPGRTDVPLTWRSHRCCSWRGWRPPPGPGIWLSVDRSADDFTWTPLGSLKY